MGMIAKLKSLVSRPASGTPPEESELIEAAGKTIDDEDGWRRLTGDVNRGLNPMTQSRMQELAVYLWRTNVLANRLVELPVAYLLAEGVKLTVSDPDAQEWLTSFWRDPINNMDIKLPKKVRELALYGEQCWPVFVNEHNGDVRLGYLDPGLIETVVTDPENTEQPIGIVVRRDKKGKQRRFKVIVNGPENVFSTRTQDIRTSFDDGECFYFTVNDLSNASRGHSDLLAQMDWLDGYDHALFGELERWDFLRAYVWDVTLKGATPDEVNKRAGEITAPKPGSVRVHNDSEEWDAVTPDLKSVDSDSFARLFRNQILGGGTIPEHWFGGGGDVNRATASEMGEPTYKILSMRQKYLGYMLVTVGTYVVRRKTLAYFGAEPEQSNHPEEYHVRAEWPEMTARDTSKYAAALGQVVLAAASAIDRGLLSEVTAVSLIAQIAAQMGLPINVQDELDSARADAAKRQEGDLYPGLDDDSADT